MSKLTTKTETRSTIDLLKKPTGNVRWQILSLLFFATTINYIDRQVIGILKPYIAGDLGWDDADYGYIVTAFQIAYAIGLLTTGRFIDKFGTRIGFVWAIVVWSIAGMAHAAARSVISFAAARFTLGIGESANFPAAVKAVAEWFPKKERALAAGLFNSGATFGAILAPIIVTAIKVNMGWEWAFIVTGLLGFIWLFFWLAFYQVPKEHPKLTKEEFNYINQDEEVEEEETPMRWTSLFKYKQTIAICLTRFFSDWVWWFFLFWIPDFLNKKHGIDIKEVVLPLIVIYAISSIGGVFGGYISSSFIKRGKSIDYARKTTILICALIVLPVMFVSEISNLWGAVLLIAFAAAGHQGWAANIFTVVSDIFPKKAVGSVMGMSGFLGAMGGALSASFVGLILKISDGGYFYIFLIASSAYLINWIIIKLMIKEIKPIKI